MEYVRFDLSTRHLPPRNSFDYWHEITKSTYRLDRPPRENGEMRLSARVWSAEKATVSEFWCQANRKTRDRKLIAADGQAFLKVRMYDKGSALVTSEGGCKKIKPGGVYIVDQSRESEEVSTDNHQLNFFVAHSEVGYRPDLYPQCMEMSADSPEGRIMGSAFRSLFDGLTNSAVSQTPDPVQEMCDTLRLVLEGAAESQWERVMRRARLRVVREDLARQISDPGFTVDRFIGQSAFSRASLYRHFSEEGGIANFIRRERLLQAYQALASAAPSAGAVSRVAEFHGYGSVYSFSKAFSKMFFVAPSDVLGTARSIEPSGPSVASQAQPLDVAGLTMKETFSRIRAS